MLFPEHYHPYFLDHYENPSLNGVAIYCKELPKAIIWGLGFDDYDAQGSTFRRTTPTSVSARVGAPPDRERRAMAHKLGFLSQLSGHLEKFVISAGLYFVWRLGAYCSPCLCRGRRQQPSSPRSFGLRERMVAGPV